MKLFQFPSDSEKKEKRVSNTPKFQQKIMDERAEQKTPRTNVERMSMNHRHKVEFAELSLEDLKRNSHLLLPPSPPAARPSKGNCLCSPTTHIGSFRCRHHRHSGLPRGGSVGSNLSDLARKSGEISASFSP